MPKPKEVKRPRILLLDIETAPLLATVWRTWKENVGLDQIRMDWHILSYCAKWLGERKVFYADQSQESTIENDRNLMVGIHSLLNEADIVVAHNGRRFDMRKINARLLIHGMQPPSPYKIVDTLEIAKKHFAFTSNRLAYLTQTLCETKKSEHPKFPGFSLWKECLAGNKEAWREMKRYNIRDVQSLEELYLILRPWMEGHPNLGAYTDPSSPVCPKCGSDHMQRRGTTHTQTGRYIRFQCQDCGGWSRGRKTINSKEDREHLLIN